MEKRSHTLFSTALWNTQSITEDEHFLLLVRFWGLNRELLRWRKPSCGGWAPSPPFTNSLLSVQAATPHFLSIPENKDWNGVMHACMQKMETPGQRQLASAPEPEETPRWAQAPDHQHSHAKGSAIRAAGSLSPYGTGVRRCPKPTGLSALAAQRLEHDSEASYLNNST